MSDGGKPIEIRQDALWQMYWVDGLSLRDIADRLGVSSATILRRMEEFGIGRRTQKPDPIPKAELANLRGEQGLTELEIAEELNCKRSKVRYWLKRYDIQHPLKQLTPEILRRLYWEDGMKISEIADEFSISEEPIRRRMEDYNIERRSSADYKWVNRASFGHDTRGYERWTATNGKYEKDRFRVHRLAAVAWFGVDKVAGSVVHHKNGITWDNREENLEVMSASDHAKLHAEERAT